MKTKLSILIALVMAIALCLAPAAALAVVIPPSYAKTFGPSADGTSVIAVPGAPNSVDVVVEDTDDGWLQWTYTYSESPTHTPKMTVAIDYPSGFCITTFDDGSHTGWYYAPDGGAEVELGSSVAASWAEADAAGNVLTVRIKKSNLGLTFKWHGYANVDGAQVWIETEVYQPVGEITIDADLDTGLSGYIDDIIAITVYPTDIDFGMITPGTHVSGDDITVTNIGTVSVVVSAGIDPIGYAFKYLFLNDVQRTNGLWDAVQLGMGTIAPTLDADCTTELQVPVTYSAKGSENTLLAFIATPATVLP